MGVRVARHCLLGWSALRRAIVLAVFAMLVGAACQSSGRAFDTTLGKETDYPLPVTLTDETTFVTAIAPAAANDASTDNEPAVRADPDDPDGLVLTWLGGACDKNAAARFLVQNGGYLLHLATDRGLGLGGCIALGVPRALRITLSRPIPADSISVAGS